MVLDEIAPKHGRVAIGGISMGGYGALLLGAQRALLRDRRPLAGALVQWGRQRGRRVRRRRGLRAPRHRQPPAALLRTGLDRRRHGGPVPQRRRPLRARGPCTAARLAGRARQRLLALAHAPVPCVLCPCTAPEPKIELHVHLEGTVRPDTLRAIAKRNDYALPDDLESLYRFRDFAHFIEVWILTTNALRTAEDFRQVVTDYAGGGRSRTAPSTSRRSSRPAERIGRGVDWDEIFSGYCDGAQEARELHGVEVRLTPDIFRGATAEKARAGRPLRRQVPRPRRRRRGARRAGGGVPARAVRSGVHARRRPSASARSRMQARPREPVPSAARSRRSRPIGSGTGSARSRIPGSSPSSPAAAPSSTSVRSRTSAPASSARSRSTRCRSSSPQASAARSRPTTRRCSTPT